MPHCIIHDCILPWRAAHTSPAAAAAAADATATDAVNMLRQDS